MSFHIADRGPQQEITLVDFLKLANAVLKKLVV